VVRRERGFPTTSGDMVAPEPGKATTDQAIKPVGDGAQTHREPRGDVAEGVAVRHAPEACGDVAKASRIASFGDLTFILEPRDRSVAKGDAHEGPRMAGSPHQGETADRIGHDCGETRRILVLGPGAKPAPIHTEVIHLCKLFGENLYDVRLDGPFYCLQIDVVDRHQGSQGPVVQVDDVCHPFNEAVQPFLAVAVENGAPVKVALSGRRPASTRS
jgi:hypothetical protein